MWKLQNRTFTIRFAHHNALFEHESNHITSVSACVLGTLVAGWQKVFCASRKKQTLLCFKYLQLLSAQTAQLFDTE
jgi:hypothetical protein